MPSMAVYLLKVGERALLRAGSCESTLSSDRAQRTPKTKSAELLAAVLLCACDCEPNSYFFVSYLRCIGSGARDDLGRF